MMQLPRPHISALIEGSVESSDGVTYFNIIVSDGVNAWSVLQRYNSFLQLHRSLQMKGVRLPRMPPKSFFRLCFLPSFKESRQLDLQSVLSAATAADPALALPPLRSFLMGPEVAQQNTPRAHPAFAQAVPPYLQQAPYCAPTGPAFAQQVPALGQPVPASCVRPVQTVPIHAQPAYAQPAPVHAQASPAFAQAAPAYAQAVPAYAQAGPAYAQAAPAYAQAVPADAQPVYPHGMPCGLSGLSADRARHENGGRISTGTAAVGAGVAGLVGGMLLEDALEGRRHIDTIGGFRLGHERIVEDVRQPIFFGLGGSEEVRETVRTDMFGDTEVRREVIDRDVFGNVEEVREEIIDRDAFGDVTERIEIDDW